MLPDLGAPFHAQLRFDWVRDLEVFEGPILSEVRGPGGVYLEKWCAQDADATRSLVVRSDQRAIAEYLGGRQSMHQLLVVNSGDVGFLVDRGRRETSCRLTQVSSLPANYLPDPSAMHDHSLRPHWPFAPQTFLLDETWDGKLLWDIERLYLEIFAFSFLTAPDGGAHVPEHLLRYWYDGGFPVMHAFRALRSAVPRDSAARAVGVHAASPGVLTIDAPEQTARRVVAALGALSRENTVQAYQVLQAWAKIKPYRADLVPDGAREDVRRLCALLGVDSGKLFPGSEGAGEKIELLVAGKLVASYFRKLRRLLTPDWPGVEFLSAELVAPVTALNAVDEEEEEEDEEDSDLD